MNKRMGYLREKSFGKLAKIDKHVQHILHHHLQKMGPKQEKKSSYLNLAIRSCEITLIREKNEQEKPILKLTKSTRCNTCGSNCKAFEWVDHEKKDS